ncbi:hypothetical protein O6P43_027803 [Quillaja saponaria]|uniref:Secreted protein n=1 Tax=Quillaja saponaria TaxID=32244 RepID=A0AAD7L589_QUISA|nr:hypothetical protein O6P43_027803 [Quillaja saponaria]
MEGKTMRSIVIFTLFLGVFGEQSTDDLLWYCFLNCLLERARADPPGDFFPTSILHHRIASVKLNLQAINTQIILIFANLVVP